MKRIFPLFLILLALSGCGSDPSPTEDPDETLPAEPTGFYDPDSSLETATDGAVHAYPLNRSDCYGLLPMDEDLLLFAGTETTTLIKVSGANLYITAEAQLDCLIQPDSCSIQANEKGVTFYDAARRQLVFLDPSLKEVSRVDLPEAIQGEPALSADRKTLYYCTDDSLRVYDMETGFHKLLREMSFEKQSVTRLHCGGTVVECTSGEGSVFLSAGTGETLYESAGGLKLTTRDQLYFAVLTEGLSRELLAGTPDIGPYCLYFDDLNAAVSPLLESCAAVLSSQTEDGSAVTLCYYDLQSGKRTAELELPGSHIPGSIHADLDSGVVWLLRYDESYGCDTLLRWDPEGTPTGDETIYIGERFTADTPDDEGLVRCQEKAAEISIRHGVDVRIWTDAVSSVPEGYRLTAEYQVPAILEALELLDEALTVYPDGFLADTADSTLRICLVRSISGDTAAGFPEDPPGIQFWDDRDNASVCLRADEDLARNLSHELFHVIDNRVLSTCSVYDDWSDLNPTGFSYSYSYQTVPDRMDLLEGSSRAFIDTDSMTFPREDRARIMEYAMLPDQEETFASPVMQAKLRTLCQGIRQAFDLEDSEETFLWEQYLEKEE